MIAPLWRTWILGVRDSTGSRVSTLLTGTGYEIICQAVEMRKDGFRIKVIKQVNIRKIVYDIP